MNLPIIRLQIEGVKYSVAMALTEYAAQVDADLQKAVEEFCTPENIGHIVQKEAWAVLDQVIREEVKSFFLRGHGREAVKAAVQEKLDSGTTYTLLDEVPR